MNEPTTGVKKKVISENSKRGENLNNTKTPAETKVAEWIKAEAGTGASIESGSQMWNPNCADFIKEHKIKKNDINSIKLNLKLVIFILKLLKNEIWDKKEFIFESFIVKKINKIDINKETSLNLLKINALNADFNVDTRVDQKLIKKNDVNPINSQPKNSTKKLPLVTKHTILITKQFIKSINLSTLGSYLK